MTSSLEQLIEALSEEEAPTAVHERKRVESIHIADSLAGLEIPEIRAADRMADLGSGAGLPGLALGCELPDARIFCVESVRKKADWIGATAVRCGLKNVEAVWARAEEWDVQVDVVVARALASLPVLCEYAAPLLAEGGTAVFWKGAVEPAEAADGRAAAAILGLSDPEVVSVKPYPRSARRTLWVFRRTGDVPDRFPRRAGMAVKRPLKVVGPRPNPPEAPVPSDAG